MHSVALDVFEQEPHPLKSYLRKYDLCIIGSHNSSNTNEAVTRTNKIVIHTILEILLKDNEK